MSAVFQIILCIHRKKVLFKMRTGSNNNNNKNCCNKIIVNDLYVTDPLGSIIANMEVKRGKSKVIEKLFSLDLVKDRKELYKRRQKRGRQGSDSDDDDVVRQNEGVYFSTQRL